LTLSCTGGSTQCGSWNFESNTGEGWQPVLTQLGTATNLQIRTAPGGSLAFSFDLNNTGTYGTTVIRVPLCNGQAASAKFHWITAQVYAQGPAFIYQSNMENGVEFSWTDPSDGNRGGGQVSLLVQIKQHPGVGIRELAALERISVPGMSKFVARLEEAGLVERAPVEGDQRRVELKLTAAGHKVLRSVQSKRTAWLAERLGQLDSDDLEAIDAAIEPLAHLLNGEAA